MIDTDLTEASNVARLRDEVLAEFGRIDILVNNVGGILARPGPLVDISDEEWQRSIDLNLTATFLCCRAITPSLVKQGHGRIINIASSRSAFAGVPNWAHYCAAKGGIVALTKGLALELAKSGVTVNAIAPGHIETPAVTSGADRGWWDLEDVVAHIPIGRGGTPEDIAYAGVFLASDEASWITGHTLHVNGGNLML
jgi:NAD(P)-dependent dehydrogenase (short-subunit alcohol dehydrogenase family)